MSILRIALIGAGIMGRQHLAYLRQLSDAALCAIVDPTEQARQLAAEQGVPWFAELQELLDSRLAEAVIIANPNAEHVPTALRCIEARLPALLEKPVGVSLDEVRELVALVEKSAVPVLVGHHRRHNPLIGKARELLQQGALGRLTTVTALWQLQKPDSYYKVLWRREPGAGVLLTNLIHDLDLLRHLCGEVQQVQALTSTAVRGFANEDSAAILLHFDNGALGSLTGSDAVAAPWSWELSAGENPVYPRQPDQACYLLAGTAGSLSIPQLRLWSYAALGAGWHEPLHSVEHPHETMPALLRQLEHFIDVARGNAQPLISAADAGRTLALYDAICRAAVSGCATAPEPI
ncbi:Gfo/Idh/MocA family protein [Pseudomonas fulva]|uniref:Oxidoreductase domain protein n=1 Tax=Pseudomonas fulva (strain 12-X) TaxID=743720 RepID=F6AFM1_PSEF1|nr:Gfo/Idh/MocA family oxidoreductase [Pseudomonas fulva]AEF22577.1 oxidoreductase domain protein [Pseudomonas fulva 12-X]